MVGRVVKGEFPLEGLQIVGVTMMCEKRGIR
jgi:hypothetical protein